MRRTLVAVASATTLVTAVAVAAPAADGARLAPAVANPYDSGGQVMNILPPGSNGNASATDAAAFEANKTLPQNYADQLEMYDALNKVVPSSLTDGDLSKYYKDSRLGGVPGDIVSTESPKAGVTIARDSFGVPHINGDTAEDVAYGAGYAGIEDRMFLTDVLRHTGAANMAAFLGPTAGNIRMDQAQLRLAPYTPAEAEAQIESAASRYGPEGQALIGRLDGFIAGMNAAQKALCPGAFGLPVPGGNGAGLGPKCPVEYSAVQKAPADYTRADIIYIASLVGGIFGKGGGGEFDNALWYQNLVAKFGAKRGKQMYDELRQKDDREAFSTAQTTFHYLSGGLAPKRPGVALPVPGAPTAPGTGTLISGSASSNTAAIPAMGTTAYHSWQQQVGVVDGPSGRIDLGFRSHDESNALLVDAKHSKNGHPVVVFGPQTGYYAPQLLTEVDLHGPGIDARGVSFAGTQFVVELGHGEDYAWSATSADSDNVDTVFEKLCNADGSAPTVRSTSYLHNGQCVPIDTYVHDEGEVLPTVAASGQAQDISMTVMRTVHGVVEERTLAKGIKGHVFPVAVVTQRSTYGHEADSAIGFARVNNPDYTHNATDFTNAFDGVDYTFNWFYTDDKDIAYKVSGLLPVRSKQTEPDLPRWGDARYDWQGWLAPNRHPHQINPPRGFLASWNNKQAPGFGVADDQWGQNAVHRVNLLAERIQALIKDGGRITPAQLVGAMIDAATADLRAEKLLPLALKMVGDDPKARPAIALLKKWVKDGAHRVDRARTGHYDDQAAIALFDTWWDDNGKGDGGLAKDTIRPLLGSLVDQLPHGTDDHPRQGVGSSWDTVAWYGYVSKALRMLLHLPVKQPYKNLYCGTATTCRKALRASLETAVARALANQHVSSVDQLTYDKTKDDIRSVAAGLVGVRPIDWQNRPTFQQVISYTSHR
ncbi:MAG TPA: penicillin acylase family protein [Mycobacteriales bacterium]|nr:penicillin acylase family protein [Mycobacteriales bacterium]